MGCIETYASGVSIVRRMKELDKQQSRNGQEVRNASVVDICHRVSDGDIDAIQIFDQVDIWLNKTTFYNPLFL
jgi:predicted NBD/HSP70 family sugar kinase